MPRGTSQAELPLTARLLWRRPREDRHDVSQRATPTCLHGRVLSMLVDVTCSCAACSVLTYITHPWVFCVPNDPEASKFLVTSDRKQVMQLHPRFFLGPASGLCRCNGTIGDHVQCMAGSKLQAFRCSSPAQVAFPSKINPDIHINMAPNLPWNLARHIPRFGENKQFMSETKNLLLAHVHLKPLHGQPQLVEPPSQPRDIPCPRSLPGSLSMSRALLLSSPRRYLKHCFSMPSTTDSPPWSPRASTGANAYSSGEAT